MTDPSSLTQALPLRHLVHKGQSLGPSWFFTKGFLELEQFVLLLPEERVLLGVVRLALRSFSPFGLGDIPAGQLTPRATRQVLADVAEGRAFGAAVHVEQKGNLVQAQPRRAGCDVDQDTFWVAPHGMPLRFDEHFRPQPERPAHYLFAAVVPHLLFDSGEALGEFCTRHRLVDHIARLDARQQLVTEPPRLPLADVRYPYRVIFSHPYPSLAESSALSCH